MTNSFWPFIVGAGIGTTWRNIGGAAIIFNFIKSFIFGRRYRIVEYPNGYLRTVIVRFPTVDAIKRKISDVYDVSPDEVRGIYHSIDNYWTEPVKTPKDIRLLPDNAYLIWTRQFGKLPDRGVNIKEAQLSNEDSTASKMALIVEGIKFLNKANAETKGTKLTSDQLRIITDLMLNYDSYLLSLYSNFKNDPETFLQYVLKKVISLEKERKNGPIGRGEEDRIHFVGGGTATTSEQITSQTAATSDITSQ